jgi:organic radical activating enzyme
MEKKNHSNSKTYFCALPWKHSFVNNGGEYQICCSGEEFNNYITNESGKIITISDNKSLSEVLNSTFMKNFRLKMLEGKKPQECYRCLKTEELGGVSRREIENSNYSEQEINELIEKTGHDGEIITSVDSADYRLGNTCNLQCRMCNPRASSKWIQQYQELPSSVQDPDFSDLSLYMNLNWNQSEILLKEFRQKAKDLKRLHFGGGEPLLSQKMLEILDYCIKHNYAKNITLSYNTNLTKLPKKVLEAWKEFQGVKILASIDAVGELNDYIRYPSVWSDVHQNLRFLDDNFNQYNLKEILVSTTVQMNNIFHLESIYSYLKQFKNIVPLPNLILLFFPPYLSLKALPRSLRLLGLMRIKTIIKDYEAKIEPHYTYLLEGLKQVEKYLEEKVSAENIRLTEEFVVFSLAFDKGKKIDCLRFNPEFKSIFAKSPQGE